MNSSGDSSRVASGSNSTGRLRLELCGRLSVRLDDAPIGDEALRRSKTRALLAMLAISPRFQLRREQVADALWPDLDGDGAANQLAKAVHALRRSFEPDLAARATSRFLESRDGMLTLTAPGGVTVDALEFRDAARFGLATGTAAALGSAVALLPDDLLPEFLYEPWTMPLREELRTLRVRVIEMAADASERSGDFRNAERLWQRLLDADAASEVAYRGLIRASVRRGDRSLALRLLATCRETLRRELEVEPDASTIAMAREAAPTPTESRSYASRREAESPERAPRPVLVERAAVAERVDPPRGRSRPLAVLVRGVRVAVTASVIVALTVLFVAATPPGRSLQRATRQSVRYAASAITGRPVEPMLVVLTGTGVAPHARVDVAGSRSGLATFADAEGRFAVPGVAWRPGQSYRIAVSQDGRTASVSRVVASHVPSDAGALDIGSLESTDAPPVALEEVTGLNSIAFVQFHDDAYLAGVVRAVTVGAATDHERVEALDKFVASLYDATAIDGRTPRETVASGSGRASDLNDTMAALARVAGYPSRLVDVGDPEHPGLTYPLVEVAFDGAWHAYDPAMGTRFLRDDGRVPSFAEVRRAPDTVRLGGAGSRAYWNEAWLRVLYASPLHRYRVVEEETGLIG